MPAREQPDCQLTPDTGDPDVATAPVFVAIDEPGKRAPPSQGFSVKAEAQAQTPARNGSGQRSSRLFAVGAIQREETGHEGALLFQLERDGGRFPRGHERARAGPGAADVNGRRLRRGTAGQEQDDQKDSGKPVSHASEHIAGAGPGGPWRGFRLSAGQRLPVIAP